MIIYALFIVHRALSGAVNGAQYGGLPRLRAVLTDALAGVTVFVCFWALLEAFEVWGAVPRWRLVCWTLGILGSVTVVLLTDQAHAQSTRFPGDVHLFTYLQQAVLAATLVVLSNPWWALPFDLALAIYPAVFLQKIAVNLLGGNRWDYAGTDDATGQTWGVPSLGIRVPRIRSMRVRAWLAIGSILAFAIKQIVL